MGKISSVLKQFRFKLGANDSPTRSDTSAFDMFTRRDFLANLSAVPALSAFTPALDTPPSLPADQPTHVRFTGDGPIYSPDEFIKKLQSIQQAKPISWDFYGKGGSVDELTKKFAELTGKEAAIYLASGTLANQLAISVLSGENTKVFVQETSHVYRDEADAAQSVFGKRLIPLAPGKAYFTVDELKKSIDELAQNEVFKSGIGAVSIENPVRRCDGQFVPIDVIKQIAAYCRQQGYKLHLDGARIYMATTFGGTSLAEYASYFDTAYISLYKYLGAAGGAVLCGPKAIIDRMEHLAKVHGGVIFMNWANAAMALHHLSGLEDRLKQSASQAKQLFAKLNQSTDLNVSVIDGGTNIFNAQLSPSIDAKKFSEILYKQYNITLPPATANGKMKLMVNDSLLNRDTERLVAAFKDALTLAKK